MIDFLDFLGINLTNWIFSSRSSPTPPPAVDGIVWMLHGNNWIAIASRVDHDDIMPSTNPEPELNVKTLSELDQAIQNFKTRYPKFNS